MALENTSTVQSMGGTLFTAQDDLCIINRRNSILVLILGHYPGFQRRTRLRAQHGYQPSYELLANVTLY